MPAYILSYSYLYYRALASPAAATRHGAVGLGAARQQERQWDKRLALVPDE